jgi:membrane-associated phospholipid phosphatase
LGTTRLPQRLPRDGWVALIGAGAYAGTAALASRHARQWERRTFNAVNHGVGRAPALRVPQQLGTPWMLPGLAAVAFYRHRPSLAVAAAVALPAEKGFEVGVKLIVRRRRPANEADDARLRDDAPADGPSYPSGHVAIAATWTTLLVPYLPPLVTAAASTTALVVGFRRVHQGAHYPLDVVGGGLLGVTVGTGLSWAFGRP